VNVWSVEYEQFEDFAAIEEFQDPDEDHVWFEDRWMVASLCDE
jgi:hypothetical protein